MKGSISWRSIGVFVCVMTIILLLFFAPNNPVGSLQDRLNSIDARLDHIEKALEDQQDEPHIGL